MNLPIRPLTKFEQAAHESTIAQAKICNHAESEMYTKLEQISQKKIYEKLGMANMYAYCESYIDLSQPVIGMHLSIIKKSNTIPKLGRGLAQREFTLSKAVKVLSIITPENQEEWLEALRTFSKSEIEKRVAAGSPKAKKRTTITRIDKNTSRLSIDLPNEVIEKLKRAQELECQRTKKHVPFDEVLATVLQTYVQKK